MNLMIPEAILLFIPLAVMGSTGSTELADFLNSIADFEKHLIEEPPIKASVAFDALHDCWLHIFTNNFVKNKLQHNVKNGDKSFDASQNCNIQNIEPLLSETNDFFNDLSEVPHPSLHELTSLRRIIMLLVAENEMQRVKEYDLVISLISDAMKIADNDNPNKIIMNMHPPRSAGSAICGYFCQAKRRQSKMPNPTKLISYQEEPWANCNAGDGEQFTHYPKDAKAYTCQQQFDLVAGNFTMIAREAPLYNNNDEQIAHPYLCPQFIYLLPVRSPIERILSWMAVIHVLHLENGKKYVPNLYHSLYSYSTNSPQSDLVKILDAKPGTPNVRIYGWKEWLRGYSSNAITKWIGYEWKNASNVKESKDITEALSVNTEKVNENDVHFYNAIKVMLQTDYVLNFASYQNDSSAQNALKYESKQFDDDIVSTFHGIGSNDSMWNVLSKHMNEHFNGTDLFEWPQRRTDLLNFKWPHFDQTMLTKQDWRTLYEQNYFDYRLYFLAKYIEKVEYGLYTPILLAMIHDMQYVIFHYLSHSHIPSMYHQFVPSNCHFQIVLSKYYPYFPHIVEK